MYVDDICVALNDETEAINVRKLINEIFNEIGMKVTKYMSNSSNVLQTIPREDLGPLMENGGTDTEQLMSANTKILGVNYDPKNDNFHFKSYSRLLEKEPTFTKRGMSSVIPSIFDVN